MQSNDFRFLLATCAKFLFNDDYQEVKYPKFRILIDHNFTDEETDKLSKNKCLARAAAYAAARAGLEAHPG